MSATIHPFVRQVSPNLCADLSGSSPKYTVCRERPFPIQVGWVMLKLAIFIGSGEERAHRL
jgi:hypothetical protein